MASRNRFPPHHLRRDEPSGFRDGPPPRLPRGRGPMPLHELEDEVAFHRLELQKVLEDNRHLVEENMAYGREISAAKEELHGLSQVIPKLRADKEAQARDLIQRGLKLEAELRGLEPIKLEALRLRSEAQKLDAMRQDMDAKIHGMSQDLKRIKAENEQIPTLRVDVDGLRQELVRARAAYDYERKANVEQLEQRQAMEKNLVSMAREIEKLRAEHQSRIGGGAYGMPKASNNPGYPSTYGDNYGDEKGTLYGTSSWGSYDQRFPRH